MQKFSVRMSLEYTRALVLRSAFGAHVAARTTLVVAIRVLLTVVSLHLKVIAAAAITVH